MTHKMTHNSKPRETTYKIFVDNAKESFTLDTSTTERQTMTRYIFLTQRRRTRRLVLGVVYFVTLAAGGTVALMAYFEGQI
jgi:hypothetical protein